MHNKDEPCTGSGLPVDSS